MNTLRWRYPTGTTSRVRCYVGKNPLLLLYSSGSPKPSSFNYGNECTSFPQTLRYARKCSAAWKSTIRKSFLIQTPCLMCIAVGTNVDEVDVCHLSKRVVLGLQHESNTSNHFNFYNGTNDSLLFEILELTALAWICMLDFSISPSVNERQHWNNSSVNIEHLPIASHCPNMRIISYVEGQLSGLNRNSRISTQHWLSLNLYIFRPMLIGNFCLFGCGEYPGKICDIGFETPCIVLLNFHHSLYKQYVKDTVRNSLYK